MYYTIKVKSILVIILLFSISSFSQVDCKVLKKDISGTYEGECEKGLANGYGTSIGENKYEGYFKKGLPNGKGVLTYADGSIFKGSFKKGLRSGEGVFTIKTKDKDSIVEGKWRKGIQLEKKPGKMYKVLYRRSVNNYRIKKLNSLQNRVTIKVYNDSNLYKSPQTINSNGGVLFNRFSTTGFDDITTFPFECSLSYTVPNKLNTGMITVDFRFEILEPGDWEVTFRH